MSIYRVIDHTADLRIRITAATIGKLFDNAAIALFDLILDRKKSTGTVTYLPISADGRDRPDLMVAWLRELLYLWNGKERVVETVRIDRLTEQRIEACVGTVPYVPEQHRVKTEIKAVTYHQIQVLHRLTGWEATVIFDV